MQSNPGKIFVQSPFCPHPAAECRKGRCTVSCTTAFFWLRQQESNLRWGSQSPLPYRLAMAHHEKQYNIFSAVPQEVRCVFAAFFCVFLAAFAAFFVGFGALRQGFLHFPYPAMFLRKLSFAGCVFQKIQPTGLKNSSCKGKIYFFLDFSYYFLQRLYFLLRFWYTGCDKNRLKKLLRRPGCARVGQCLHLCEGKRGIS